MFSELFKKLFGEEADEVHLFGNSFRERIEEGVEIVIEGLEGFADAIDSFDDDEEVVEEEVIEEVADEN